MARHCALFLDCDANRTCVVFDDSLLFKVVLEADLTASSESCPAVRFYACVVFAYVGICVRSGWVGVGAQERVAFASLRSCVSAASLRLCIVVVVFAHLINQGVCRCSLGTLGRAFSMY